MNKLQKRLGTAMIAMLSASVISTAAYGHGNVTPQAVDNGALEKLGTEWKASNPYGKSSPSHDEALRIGASAYNQNCAACHGLDGISGGINPDLRLLETGPLGDEWYVERVRNGAVRDGRVYMPKMADFLSQEVLWAIRTWLESVAVKQ